MELPDTIDGFLKSISWKITTLLKEGKTVVSGSTALYYFMLKNGLKPEFEPSDIDLFTTETKESIESLKILPDKHIKKQLKGKYNHVETIKDVISYEVQHYDMKIDIIFVSEKFTGSPSEYIKQTFDLDICKCWYDGYELYGPLELIKSGKCILTHTNIDLSSRLPIPDILQYFSDIRRVAERAPDPYHLIARVKKYTERGFEIDTSQLEIPREITERYIQFCLSLLNIHRLKPVDIIICYGDLKKISEKLANYK